MYHAPPLKIILIILIILSANLRLTAATRLDPFKDLGLSPNAPALLVAPSKADWIAAFARLDHKQQEAIKRLHLSIELPKQPVDDTLYLMRRDYRTGEIDTSKRLDLAAIVKGFNDAFRCDAPRTWTLVKTESCDGIEDLNGAVRFWIRLDWALQDAKGETTTLSESDSGLPKIVENDTSPLIIEMNTTFATVFLELVAQLEK